MKTGEDLFSKGLRFVQPLIHYCALLQIPISFSWDAHSKGSNHQLNYYLFHRVASSFKANVY